MQKGRRTTTEMRDALRQSQTPAAQLALQFGINAKTALKWRHRANNQDLPKGPKRPHSTVLTWWEETFTALFRQLSGLPLDDLLAALRPAIPRLTRSSLHRLLRRRGISRIRVTSGGQELVACALPLRLGDETYNFFIGMLRASRLVGADLVPASLPAALPSLLTRLAAQSPRPLQSITLFLPTPGPDATPLPEAFASMDLRTHPLETIFGTPEVIGPQSQDLIPANWTAETLAEHLGQWVDGYNQTCRLGILGGKTPAQATDDAASDLPAAGTTSRSRAHPIHPRAHAATIRDVAARVGVSAMTVSRVINGDGDVKISTRQLVTQAIRDLDYAPNTSARRLVGGKVVRIGLLHGNPSAAYLGELLTGAIDEAGRSGHQLVLERCKNDELEAIRRLIARRVDGIILPPPLSDMEILHRELKIAGIAAVAFGTARDEGSPSVSIDDWAAARDMTRHLIALGHHDIAFIEGHPNQAASHLRLKGFLAALDEAGMTCPAHRLAQGYFSYDSGIAAAGLLLDRPPFPSAIFASNDDMAAATLAVAYQHGISVPRDLSVAGFDDTLAATLCWPALTTVCQPIATMARQAVVLLTETIRRPARPPGGHLTVPFTIIQRDSCAAPRNGAPPATP